MSEPILVVDDQRELRLLIRLSLSSLGAVATAATLNEAREQIRRAPPRLLILDVRLGADSGLALCRQLKADPATQAIRIILLSGHAQRADIAAGVAAGADHYMAKPFSPGALLAAASALLNARLA